MLKFGALSDFANLFAQNIFQKDDGKIFKYFENG